jgi:protein-S-isoprenylcysteine O-methyltransferase Ste14
MDARFSLPQASLAGTILLSAAGTCVAVMPPNPNRSSSAELTKKDTIKSLNLTSTSFILSTMSPLWILAAHTAGLAYCYPHIPPEILGYGAHNGLNPTTITWSTATAVPLAAILGIGVPLRLAAYSGLGKNFTFALAEPDRLSTGGIYRYVQHPSYTGLLTLIVSTVALLGRLDGAVSCWIPARFYGIAQWVDPVFALAGVGFVISTIWMRVRQEEEMLKGKFGKEWEEWHARTARFVPWVF